ncbi:MAG TPA: DUF3231 family protein [Bacillales bacterium]|nr:DUF3231 family protein [Bacillales bacterium]
MELEHHPPLTSAEISQIWSAYQNDSMASCVLQHFMQHVNDPDITSLLDDTLQMTQSHIQSLTDFFNKENWPLPNGFTEADVNPDAPRLFSDSFMLYYAQQMGIMGINAMSMAISLSTRQDVYGYFTDCLSAFGQLHQRANELLLEKGLYIRPPYIPTPESTGFVTDQSFLGGWFGENRPLTALEIANLYANIQRNALGKALLTGFSQVASSQEARKYTMRGKEIATKHIEIFSSKLNQDDLPASVSWDAEVTDSTVAPFSDKLMMFHTTGLTAISIGYYGTCLATSLRRDVSTDYSRLTTEIMKYSLDGAKLMIDNGWMEEPPQAPDRGRLAKSKD